MFLEISLSLMTTHLIGRTKTQVRSSVRLVAFQILDQTPHLLIPSFNVIAIILMGCNLSSFPILDNCLGNK